MKKFITLAVLTVLSCIAFAASAVNLTNEVVLSNGGVYNITSMKTITVTNPVDLGKLQQLPGWAGYVQLGSGSTYINVTAATQVICSNNILTVGWAYVGSQDYSDPGCATFNLIKSRSVQ